MFFKPLLNLRPSLSIYQDNVLDFFDKFLSANRHSDTSNNDRETFLSNYTNDRKKTINGNTINIEATVNGFQGIRRLAYSSSREPNGLQIESLIVFGDIFYPFHIHIFPDYSSRNPRNLEFVEINGDEVIFEHTFKRRHYKIDKLEEDDSNFKTWKTINNIREENVHNPFNLMSRNLTKVLNSNNSFSKELGVHKILFVIPKDLNKNYARIFLINKPSATRKDIINSVTNQFSALNVKTRALIYSKTLDISFLDSSFKEEMEVLFHDYYLLKNSGKINTPSFKDLNKMISNISNQLGNQFNNQDEIEMLALANIDEVIYKVDKYVLAKLQIV